MKMSIQTEVELWTPSECDVKFRLHRGAARAAAKAGLVPCVERAPKEGSNGKPRYFIAPDDARAFWGPKAVVA
jgi:hypothetical protein